MSNEDIILSIGVDVSSIRTDMTRAAKEAQNILSSQKLIADIAFQSGVSQGAIRNQLKGIVDSANNYFKNNAAQLVVDASLKNQQNPFSAYLEQINQLPRLRYALYDVASTAQTTSNALLDFGTSTVKAAMDYETAFTNVERVTLTSGDAAATLKQQLMSLSEQIPMTFQDITGVATLGAQLGISNSALSGFTKTVTQFSAVTNVSNESAAQTFGKLANVLNFTSADFDKFASSVAYAGSKSAATESQILSTASQIGGVAAAAGYSADQVVGLSTAIASLGIAPEQARGALVKMFQDINRSVVAGGVDLQNYANLLGMSTKDASALAQTNMPEFFNKLVQSMSGMSNTQITQTLDALGLKGVYVTNVMTRLATNTDLLTTSQQNASKAFSDGTFLSDSYGRKADDLATKVQILQNVFNNLIATIGVTMSGPIKSVIDVIITILKGFEMMAQSDPGKTFLGVAVAASFLGSAMLGVIATMAIFLAGTYAATTALTGLIAEGVIPATSWLARVAASIFGVGIAGETAAVGVNVLKAALITSGIGAAAVLIGTIVAGVMGMNNKTPDATKSTQDFSKAIADAKKQMSDAIQPIDSGTDSIKNLGGAAGGAAEKVRTLVDYSNDLSSVFKRAFDIRFGGQDALDKINKSFSSIAKSTADARAEIDSLNADIASLTADKALQEYFLSVANAYGDTLSASKINANLAKINSDLTSKNKSLAAAQDKSNKTLVGNSDAAIENRATITGLVSDYQNYLKTLAASGASQAELSAKASQLQQDFITQATQLGYNSTELATYSAAFNDVSTILAAVPRNVTVAFDGNPALLAINEFTAQANAQLASVGAGGIGIDFNKTDKNLKTTKSQFDEFCNSVITSSEALREKIIMDQKIAAAVAAGDLQTAFGLMADNVTNTVMAKTQQIKNLTRDSVDTIKQKLAELPDTVSSTFVFENGKIVKRADGGYISGPGTATSDSIPARLSNGEYVIQASAVSRYGIGFFDQLNRMQTPHFASGGYVSAPSSSGIVSLSPEDRAILRSVGGSGEVVLYANNVELARSVNDGNRTIVAQGGRP